MPSLLLNSWEDDPPDSDRRPSSIHPVWEPNLDSIDKWTASVGKEGFSPVMLAKGPSNAHRTTLYRMAKAVPAEQWIARGLVVSLTERMSKLRAIGSIIPHQWDLLWNLLTLENLEVEGSVRLLVDQGLAYSEAFKAIWEARFRLDEGRELKDFVATLSRWMTASLLTSTDRERLGSLGIENELRTPHERLDMLFFLAALAAQNNLLAPTVIYLESLDLVVTQASIRKKILVKELFDLCIAADRWARIGSPIGFLLGYSGERETLDSLTRSHDRLGYKLKSYAAV